MQVTYALSQPIIPVGESVSLDLLIDFNAVAGGEIATRRPLNLSLAIDRSGSMGGTPLRYAIKAAQQLVDKLTPEDFTAPTRDRSSSGQEINWQYSGGWLYQSQWWLVTGVRTD
jgi:hypothetical protein